MAPEKSFRMEKKLAAEMNQDFATTLELAAKIMPGNLERAMTSIWLRSGNSWTRDEFSVESWLRTEGLGIITQDAYIPRYLPLVLRIQKVKSQQYRFSINSARNIANMLLPVISGMFLLLQSVNAEDNTTCGYTCINGLTSRCNYQKCGDLVDDLMVPYNAFYKGTLSLALTGNPTSCTQQLYTMDDYTVAIGGMKVAGDSNLDRTKYDNNPFYLWFKYQESKNISAWFLSSSDYYITESQWWTLQSSKSGDGFDISGNYTGTLTPYSNVYNYPTDSCWTVNIYNYIASADMTDPTNYKFWTISGHISPTKVDIVIDQTIFDGMEWHTKFSYVGDATDEGGKLVTSEACAGAQGDINSD